MRLEKFYAESMTEVLTKIQKKLGSDAIIYSQTKTDKGIEVVAGITKPDTPTGPVFSDNLTKKTEDWLERIQKIDNPELQAELIKMEKLTLLQQKLRQLKFPHDFIERIASTYAEGCDKQSILSNEIIIKILLSKITIQDTEFIENKKICALVGPTGIGKSTTIAKLAKRFASKYGAKKLGIISTDFQRIITKNQFHYFGKLLDIQIEYARDAMELRDAIHVLEDKQLTLIDTAGVSQNDNQKIAELFERLSGDISGIATYLVLPCNLQSDILNDVVAKFRMPHTAGCIMTKRDESKTIAPCISVIMNHQLPIAYWCNGQNIAQNIHVPNKAQIINAIFQGEKSDGYTTIPV